MIENRAPKIAWLALLVATATLSLSAGTARSSSDELVEESIVVGGASRTYSVHRPADLAPGHPVPALVVLHGGLSSGARMARASGVVPYADRLGFVALFPDSGERQWNDGRETTRSDRDDVAFILAMIDRFVEAGTVDRARVFVVGMSNGGMMAQRLGCEAPGRFKAIAAIVANLPSALRERCRSAAPVPIVLFAGTGDRIMPWYGGDVARTRIGHLGAGGRVLSAFDTVEHWAAVGHCEHRQRVMSESCTDEGLPVLEHRFDQCRDGVRVVLYELAEAHHHWPGAGRRGRSRARRVFATDVIVAFFRSYGL